MREILTAFAAFFESIAALSEVIAALSEVVAALSEVIAAFFEIIVAFFIVHSHSSGGHIQRYVRKRLTADCFGGCFL